MPEEKSWVEVLMGRFSHPIIGAFTFYWLVCNWEVVYMLLQGGSTFAETIKTLKAEYFIHANWSKLLGWPFLFTLVYLLAGPWLGDAVKQIPKWSEAWWDNKSPVPKQWLTSEQARAKAAEREKEFFIEAYNINFNSADPSHQLVNQIRQVQQYREREEGYQKEIAILKANRTVSELGKDIKLIQSENTQMKEDRKILVEISNFYLEFRKKHYRNIKDALTYMAIHGDKANEVNETIQAMHSLEEVLRNTDLTGLNRELFKTDSAAN